MFTIIGPSTSKPKLRVRGIDTRTAPVNSKILTRYIHPEGQNTAMKAVSGAPSGNFGIGIKLSSTGMLAAANNNPSNMPARAGRCFFIFPGSELGLCEVFGKLLEGSLPTLRHAAAFGKRGFVQDLQRPRSLAERVPE